MRDDLGLTIHGRQQLILDSTPQPAQVVETPGQAQVPRPLVGSIRGRGCHRTRLQQDEKAIVDRPLNVLRRAEDRFCRAESGDDLIEPVGVEGRRRPSQVFDLGSAGGEREPAAGLGWAVLDDPAGCGIDRPVVGLDGAVDEALVEAVNRLDRHAPGSGGVDPERDARDLAFDESLDDHRHGTRIRVDPEFAPIEQRPVGPQRGPHRADGVDDLVDPADPDERVVEPGERGALGVLAERRRPHCQRPGCEFTDQALGELGLDSLRDRRRAGNGCGSAAPCPRSPPSACRRSSCGRAPGG